MSFLSSLCWRAHATSGYVLCRCIPVRVSQKEDGSAPTIHVCLISSRNAGKGLCFPKVRLGRFQQSSKRFV